MAKLRRPQVEDIPNPSFLTESLVFLLALPLVFFLAIALT